MSNPEFTRPFDHEQVDGIEGFEEVLIEAYFDMTDRFRTAFMQYLDLNEVLENQQGVLFQINGDANGRRTLMDYDQHESFLLHSKITEPELEPCLTLVRNQYSDQIINGKRGIFITVVQMRPNDFIFQHESISFRDPFGNYDLSGGGTVLEYHAGEFNIHTQEPSPILEIEGQDLHDVDVNIDDLWSMIEAGNSGIAMLLDAQASIIKKG